GEGGVRELRALGEELRVGRIGAGITAFDIVEAELVEHAGDDQFVVHGEVDAVHLRAVAQRRIEEIEALAAHVGFLEGSSVLVMVVLASHSSPHGIELRCWATKPRCEKNGCAVSLTSADSFLAPRAPASFSSASISEVATPCPTASGWT